ncbi:hypothetical protein V491_06048, partial [Pseudogymnoascus sp. VKM F-3775]
MLNELSSEDLPAEVLARVEIGDALCYPPPAPARHPIYRILGPPEELLVAEPEAIALVLQEGPAGGVTGQAVPDPSYRVPVHASQVEQLYTAAPDREGVAIGSPGEVGIGPLLLDNSPPICPELDALAYRIEAAAEEEPPPDPIESPDLPTDPDEGREGGCVGVGCLVRERLVVHPQHRSEVDYSRLVYIARGAIEGPEADTQLEEGLRQVLQLHLLYIVIVIDSSITSAIAIVVYKAGLLLPEPQAVDLLAQGLCGRPGAEDIAEELLLYGEVSLLALPGPEGREWHRSEVCLVVGLQPAPEAVIGAREGLYSPAKHKVGCGHEGAQLGLVRSWAGKVLAGLYTQRLTPGAGVYPPRPRAPRAPQGLRGLAGLHLLPAAAALALLQAASLPEAAAGAALYCTALGGRTVGA